jgi:hypothetical protein
MCIDGTGPGTARREVPAAPMTPCEAAAQGCGSSPQDLLRRYQDRRSAAVGQPRTGAVLVCHFLRRSRRRVRWMGLQHGAGLCVRGEPQQEMEPQRQPPAWNSSQGRNPHLAAGRSGAYGR